MQLVPLSTKKTKIAIVSLMIGGEDRFLELCSPLFSYIAPETAVGSCKVLSNLRSRCARSWSWKRCCCDWALCCGIRRTKIIPRFQQIRLDTGGRTGHTLNRFIVATVNDRRFDALRPASCDDSNYRWSPLAFVTTIACSRIAFIKRRRQLLSKDENGFK